ncbi:sigma-70 family RNA polymerase sigma factor [Segniliparus rugosus]|uniref:Sigma-70 family RNA polymerase sigma factor n=1 Tax=Segniliparus rugosus (strain ATCC BAA-974 / DSM 45345 / CCUG 50838 / CIP 108380 / JCM 13579 / CDC 945) TaxID=679197 RepID=E5XPW1_SEGRC|nr:sigma-70 family RNA polymerase sigma factor [Segniliparus rugosus]EFV13612.1 sigma-70 family RNA polymerase sigma factor [Segniliparus rugosus ATCC BAA-974]
MANGDSEDRATAFALAAARGDRKALAAFVAETQRDVWRFLAHLTDTTQADDLAQETYLRAMTSIVRFEGRSNGKVWLLSIARRVAVDQIRSAVARPRLAPGADPGLAPSVRRREVAEHSAQVELSLVKILLDDLAPERREALVLTQMLGLSYAEAAAVCDCPVGTVRSRVARAREDLIGAGREQPGDASRVLG